MVKKSENTRLLFLNSLSGIITQVITLLLALIVPRLVLVHYGSDTNGFTNTITQVFTYMALLESGIAQAAKNALYKPIKDNDTASISEIMSVTKRYYNKITIIYFLLVLLISFTIPLFIKSNIQFITMALYILFQGMTNVVIFYFSQKWSTFLMAEGKAFVVNLVTLLNKVLCYTVYILLSLFEINIVFVQVSFFILSFLQVGIYYIYMKKHFGWIDYKSFSSNSKLKDKNSFVVSEVAWTIFSSTDMMVLSFFISTSIASVYSIYNMVFLALSNLLNSVYLALNYRLGIKFHESVIEYEKVHDFYIGFFVGAMCSMMSVSLFLTIPFVKLYTEGVKDIDYIYTYLPILFASIQVISWSRYIPGNLVGLSGRQKKAVKINVLEAILNLSLSMILVNFLGIVGVTMATLIVLPIKVVYCIFVSDCLVMKRKVWCTIRLLLPNYILFALSILLSLYLKVSIEDYLSFFLYGIALFFAFVICYFLINLGFNKAIRTKIKLIFKNGNR